MMHLYLTTTVVITPEGIEHQLVDLMECAVDTLETKHVRKISPGNYIMTVTTLVE